MNHAQMYAILCGAASDAIEHIDHGDSAAARACLLAALEEAEELYLSAGEVIPLFPPKDLE